MAEITEMSPFFWPFAISRPLVYVLKTASATLGREIDYTLGENSEQVLAEIEAALQRIENGTYGVCRKCGREISAERLEAYPWASLCIDDARLAERV